MPRVASLEPAPALALALVIAALALAPGATAVDARSAEYDEGDEGFDALLRDLNAVQATAASLALGQRHAARVDERGLELKIAHVVRSFPHRKESFCQGLVWHKGALLESSGLWGQSQLAVIDPQSGAVRNSASLAPMFFAEGVTVLNGTAYQLTYQEGRVFTYDADTLRRTGELPFPQTGPFEGWGIATDGERLIVSDGSSTLYFLDSAFRPLYTRETQLSGLNELEFVNGEVLANVYGTDCIARIDPTSGRLLGYIVAPRLWAANPSPAIYVLNGIAVADNSQRLIITGKLWPQFFEVELTDAPPTLSARSACAKHEMTAEDSLRAARLLAMRSQSQDRKGR